MGSPMLCLTGALCFSDLLEERSSPKNTPDQRFSECGHQLACRTLARKRLYFDSLKLPQPMKPKEITGILVSG
jgi:hypothetical protein